MTNCNSPQFPAICSTPNFNKFFPNTGEDIYYQEISPISDTLLDDVVLIKKDGVYYKAIYTENTINIEWYRCSFINNPNDEEMIKTAVKTTEYLGAILRFDARNYIVNNEIFFQGLSCFKLLGDKQHTLIKSDSGERFLGYFFNFNDCSNFIIDGINFDQNKRNLQEYTLNDYPNDYNGGIIITNSSAIEICNCHFYDLYTKAINIDDCHDTTIITIKNNYFESEIQTQKYRMEHLTLSQSHNVNFIIENNIFKNTPTTPPNPAVMPCGLTAFDCGYNGSILVKDNIFEYCGRNNEGTHRLFALDFYDNVNNFIVSNNFFKNTTWGAIRFDGTKRNAMITDNYIHQLIANDSGIISASSRPKESFDNVFKNISINNNIIESVVSGSYGILLQSQEDDVKAENINILNNTFNYLKTAISIGGNIMHINISDNNASDIADIGIEYLAYSITIVPNPPGDPILVKRLTAPLGNTLISNNNFKANAEGNAFVGITLESYIPTSQEEFIIVNNLTKRFVISNNLVTGNGYNFGILTNITAGSVPYGTSLDGKVTVSGNELSDFQRGIYLRVNDTIAKDNIIFNCSTNPIFEDSNVTNIMFQNYYNNAPI